MNIVHNDIPKRSVVTKKQKLFSLPRKNHRRQKSATPETETKKLFHLWHNRVDLPLVAAVNQTFILCLIFYDFSLQ